MGSTGRSLVDENPALRLDGTGGMGTPRTLGKQGIVEAGVNHRCAMRTIRYRITHTCSITTYLNRYMPILEGYILKCAGEYAPLVTLHRLRGLERSWPLAHPLR